MKNAVTVYTESNPNPNTLKFVANFMLVPEGVSRDYPSEGDTAEAPLAKALYENFEFISGVFYMNNFITVTKNEHVDWFEVKGAIQQFIKEWLESEKPVLTEDVSTRPATPASAGSGSEVIDRIEDILEEYIKPAVEMDGGAIKLSSYEDGIVTVALQGSCSGCPSSTITLKNGIENLLKREIPEVKEVVAEEA